MGKLIRLPGVTNRTPDGKRLHTCGVCGKVDVWGPTWWAYGSLKDEDDGIPYFRVCSDRCKDDAIRGGRR